MITTPVMLVFLAAWAVVSYGSHFYQDLQMASSIQIILNLTTQLLMVLIIIDVGCGSRARRT